MAFHITDQVIGSQRINENAPASPGARHPVGTILPAADPVLGSGVFIYLKGVASTAVGSLVLYNPDDFSTSLAVADDKGSLAIAMAATLANEFGWYQIRGKGSVKALTGFADNADVYLTATDGSVDDAVVSGDLVFGMLGAGAVDGGLAEVELDNPNVRDGDIIDGTAITSTGAELNILDGVTATADELNYLDLGSLGTGALEKAVVLDAGEDYVWPAGGILTYGVLKDPAATTLGATAAELNNAADVSARTQELTVSGAVVAGKQSVELNHTGTIIEATIADASLHQGLFIVKDTSATGTIAHTLTLTSGTWNSTGNTIATFNLLGEAVVVYFDSAGNGTLIANVDGVAFS